MTDHLAATTLNFLQALKGVRVTEPPPPDRVRLITDLAQWLACQRNNPFRVDTITDLALWGHADAVLAWLADPSDRRRQADFVDAQTFYGDCLADELGEGA